MVAAQQLAGQLNRAAGDAGLILADNRQGIKDAVKDLRESMKGLRLLTESATHVLYRSDERMQGAYKRLVDLAGQLQRLSEAAERLVDLVSEQPSILLFSKPRSETAPGEAAKK